MDGRDPCVVLDPLIAVDKGDEEVSKQAGDVEGDQGKNQVVLLLRLEQISASFPSPSIRADLVGVALPVQVALVAEKGLLFARLVHRYKIVGRSYYRSVYCFRGQPGIIKGAVKVGEEEEREKERKKKKKPGGGVAEDIVERKD
jgi:hypothetical protein